MKHLYEVIRRPVLSEKSAALAEVAGKYAFEVASTANKEQIRDAVEGLFNVKVQSVRTMVMHGKWKRFSRSVKKQSNWKKAIVTLKEGQKIDFFQAQQG